MSFDQLTPLEPLPGGFTRGDVVWATSDLPLVKLLGGQGSKMVMVKKHTKGSILGLPDVDPTQLLASWEGRRCVSFWQIVSLSVCRTIVRILARLIVSSVRVTSIIAAMVHNQV